MFRQDSIEGYADTDGRQVLVGCCLDLRWLRGISSIIESGNRDGHHRRQRHCPRSETMLRDRFIGSSSLSRDNREVVKVDRVPYIA